MTPRTDAENWRTLTRFIEWAKKQPLLMVFIGATTVGPVGNYLGASKADPRLDSIMVAVNEIRRVVAVIGPLQDTVNNIGIQVIQLDARVAALEDPDNPPPRHYSPRYYGLGRRRELR